MLKFMAVQLPENCNSEQGSISIIFFIHFIKYLLLSGVFLRVVDSTDRHGPCPQKALKKSFENG